MAKVVFLFFLAGRSPPHAFIKRVLTKCGVINSPVKHTLSNVAGNTHLTFLILGDVMCDTGLLPHASRTWF